MSCVPFGHVTCITMPIFRFLHEFIVYSDHGKINHLLTGIAKLSFHYTGYILIGSNK